MLSEIKTDVLIVGAGPTGLLAANQLMRFGVDFAIIDKKEGPTKESRAIVVTARTLELYQQMGIADFAILGGKKMTSFNLYSGGKRKTEVKIGEIGKGLSEFSYTLAFEQSKNEELLAGRLTENGKKIFWGHEFVQLTEHKNGIKAVAKNNNETIHISAKYLIACDGASSPVRHQLDFSFKGGTYKHKFFVADTVMKWDLDYNQFIIAPGDDNFCAFLPLAGYNRYRVLGTFPDKYFKKEDISFRDIEAVVLNTIGLNIQFESVNWFSIYKLHHRGVDHFRKGDVFLAGDSAHIHSPAGGQGMNTGLQDAYNLCWKLALVLKKQANPLLLDTYNEERLPFAKWLLKFTDRGFNMMTSSNPVIKLFRKYIALNLVGAVTSIGAIKTLVFKILSQTRYSYKGRSLSASLSRQKLSISAGDRIPYFPAENMYDKFTDACFHLLHIHTDPLNEDLQDHVKNIFPFPVKIVEEKIDGKWRKLGVKSELFILVRPDNYIALIADKLDDKEINNYLKKSNLK